MKDTTTLLRRALWNHFGAAIDTFRAQISLCGDPVWEREKKIGYLCYHVSIFLDYYLSAPVRDFRPALPYTLADPDHLPPEAIDDVLPARAYSRKEMLDWLDAVRSRCRKLILQSTDADFSAPWIQPEEVDLHGLCPDLVVNYSRLEILLYNLRHLQHHVGQLNLLLRQHLGQAADWLALPENEAP